MNEKIRNNGPVVLVSRDISFTFPLSYAYLTGYLKEKGENVRLLFRDKSHGQLVQEIMALNPVLVGFGNLYPELKEISEIIKLLNQAGRKFPIVIGGQMVSPIPEFALSITGAEFGVIGEGEIILYKLVQALRKNENPDDIHGIAVRKGDKVKINPPGEIIMDISELPAIPYELFNEDKWLPIGKWYAGNVPQPHWRMDDRVVNIHGGRGCPFTCNFCYHHGRARYRPMEKMMQEAKEAIERFNANFLYFSDDLVVGTPKRARELIDGIRKLKKPIEYSISARFDILKRMDDTLLQELKDTGCRIMGLGIESGSDRILQNIIGKKYNKETVLTGLQRLKKVGILPTVSIMVGQHSETREDVEQSIELMRQSVRENPNIQYAFTITTPFPGSELYNRIFEEGYLKDDFEFYEKYFSNKFEWNQVVNMSAMSDEEVMQMHQKINRVYKDEVKKALGKRVILLEYLQIAIIKIKNPIIKKIIRIFFRGKFLEKLEKLIDISFEIIIRQMEKIILKARGMV